MFVCAVDGISGDVLCEVEAELSWTLRDLKGAIFEATGITRMEQRLLWGSGASWDISDFLASGHRTVRVVRISRAWIPQLEELASSMGMLLRRDHLDYGDGSTVVAYASPQLDTMLRDRGFVLAAVAENGGALAHTGPFRSDREVVLAACREGGTALAFAAPELRADHGVVLAAVTQSGAALEYAAEVLRSDKAIGLAAVWSCPEALRFASEELRRDRDFVLEAVGSSGGALAYAWLDLKRDRGFALAAVEKNGDAIHYVIDEFRTDQEIALAAQRFWNGVHA